MDFYLRNNFNLKIITKPFSLRVQYNYYSVHIYLLCSANAIFIRIKYF